MKAIEWLNVAKCSASRINTLRGEGLPLKGEQSTLRMAAQLALRTKNREVEQNINS